MLTSLMRGTTALVCLSLAMPALAQDSDPGFLGTLVLTGGKRDLSFGTALSRTVVDEEEIQDRQASTVAQLIDSVPGVTLVNGTTPQGSGINIRGFGANTTYGSDQKIAVMIDGATVGSEEIYRIGTQLFTDPLLYRQAEVLRGTIGSFAYGSGIVGGVVKLETKDASDFTGGVPGFGGSQTLEYSSNGDGFATSTNLAWMPTEGAEFLLNYTLRDQDDLTAGDGKTIGNSAFRTPSYLAKAKFTFGADDAHSLTFSHSRTVADDKNVPYDQFQTSAGSFGSVDRLTDTEQSTLEYRYNPANDLIDLTATLSYADQQIDTTYIDGSSEYQFGSAEDFCASAFTGVVCADNRYQTKKLTISNRALFATGMVQHDMLAGVEAIRKERLNASSAPGGTDRRLAAFVVDEMTIGQVTVTPALRYESSRLESSETLVGVPQNYEKDALMGGLALGYDFGNGFSVFGSAAYTEGLPLIDDLGASATSQRRLDMTEKSKTFELGAAYTGMDVFARGDNLTLRGNLYKTELWDITTYTASGDTSTDLDRVETKGVELEASYGMASGLYFDLAGHVGEGTEFDPDGTSAVWRNSASDRVQLAIGRKWDDRLDLSWEVVHATDRRDSAGADLSDATVHNLRATWRPADVKWLEGSEVRFGIENALDLDYVGHLSSATRKAPGRTFKVALTKSF
ncbi:TonB-dependent receptor plug domain-containing protein [Sagittula sp. MA-2]|jgi:hemoglobin/transferrin/lactoferrin receptor protein|uniref:TonB-dependent receptor plug domain-containing protein n=1 Tax=Sagittula sp. MA-2 TaxID=3048007 RepID=UPI0024C36F2B|nr:TonB-dependent receptor plug domain-containing protein [Sagittula sp. MA-2]WHZ36447.1 TonB-dependent receptor plug domain-containing protein [Sagittula sp. MA-2]